VSKYEVTVDHLILAQGTLQRLGRRVVAKAEASSPAEAVAKADELCRFAAELHGAAGSCASIVDGRGNRFETCVILGAVEEEQKVKLSWRAMLLADQTSRELLGRSQRKSA
jgi:hypothetical protein